MGIRARSGSSPKCEITLIKDPSIHPVHAVIHTQNGTGQASRTLTASPGCSVSVNDLPVQQHGLRPGDQIGVGTMTIAYSEREVQPAR